MTGRCVQNWKQCSMNNVIPLYSLSFSPISSSAVFFSLSTCSPGRFHTFDVVIHSFITINYRRKIPKKSSSLSSYPVPFFPFSCRILWLSPVSLHIPGTECCRSITMQDGIILHWILPPTDPMNLIFPLFGLHLAEQKVSQDLTF